MAWATKGHGYGSSMRIVCPSCGKAAQFLTAGYFWGYQSVDREAVAALPGLALIRDPVHGEAVIYRRGLGGEPGDDLIAWAGPLSLTLRSGTSFNVPFESEGSCLCPHCGYRRAHRVRWPADAWYHAEVRDQVLWAWERGHAEAIIDYIEHPEGKVLATMGFGDFIKRIPRVFFTDRHKGRVVTTLRRQLEGDPASTYPPIPGSVS